MAPGREVCAVRRQQRLGSLALQLIVIAEAVALAAGLAWYFEMVTSRDLGISPPAPLSWSGCRLALPCGFGADERARLSCVGLSKSDYGDLGVT
jgi:hypothetical protein